MKFQTDLVDYKILVIGLEGAGKSSIVNMIVNREKLEDPMQTMGVETIPYESGSVNTKTIIFYEVGGNKHNRGLIQFYYNCHGVIYVLDSLKHDQIAKEPYKEKPKYEYTDNRTGNLLPIPLNDSNVEHNFNSSITDSSPDLSPSPAPFPKVTLDENNTFDDDSKTDDTKTDNYHDDEYYNQMDVDQNTNTKSKSTSKSKSNKPKPSKISSLVDKFEKLDETVADDEKTEDPQSHKNDVDPSETINKTQHLSVNSLHSLEVRDKSHSFHSRSRKLSKLLGIENEDEILNMPIFGRSKSAALETRAHSSNPVHTTDSSPNLQSSRNSFVDKFKRRKSLKLKSKTKLKNQSSIGSITLTDEQMKFLPKLGTTVSLKSGNDMLVPLTMNEAKCESAQELISKLNYELKSTDIPFLIYYNKQDKKEALSSDEITKQIEYERIIHKDREYAVFECCSSRKDDVLCGFNWLLKCMKDIDRKHKIYAKEIELLNRLNSIDLNIFGPNAKSPKCFICNQPCRNTGSFCTVCGKWYCQRDVITSIILRKSGNSKCRECVGQKSIFGVEDRKQTK